MGGQGRRDLRRVAGDERKRGSGELLVTLRDAETRVNAVSHDALRFQLAPAHHNSLVLPFNLRSHNSHIPTLSSPIFIRMLEMHTPLFPSPTSHFFFLNLRAPPQFPPFPQQGLFPI